MHPNESRHESRIPSLAPAAGRTRTSPPATRPAPVERLEDPVLFAATIDIQGVENGALDQPRVHVFFRDPATGQALGGTGSGDLNDGADVQAFLDTGSSGILLSQETAQGLGLDPATQGNDTI